MKYTSYSCYKQKILSLQCLPFEYYKAIEKADIFEKRFRTYSSTSEFSQNLWKKEETQRNVYLVCVIGHAKFWYV